ncbi:MAG: hypothetical protein B6I24_06280 [Bacteroidetes bacterium 4572_128]|nr:MAG: hypothetical protein B6I24_06280 [Bacteroidetes bacterium 4572_128]
MFFILNQRSSLIINYISIYSIKNNSIKNEKQKFYIFKFIFSIKSIFSLISPNLYKNLDNKIGTFTNFVKR